MCVRACLCVCVCVHVCVGARACVFLSVYFFSNEDVGGCPVAPEEFSPAAFIVLWFLPLRFPTCVCGWVGGPDAMRCSVGKGQSLACTNHEVLCQVKQIKTMKKVINTADGSSSITENLSVVRSEGWRVRAGLCQLHPYPAHPVYRTRRGPNGAGVAHQGGGFKGSFTLHPLPHSASAAGPAAGDPPTPELSRVPLAPVQCLSAHFARADGAPPPPPSPPHARGRMAREWCTGTSGSGSTAGPGAEGWGSTCSLGDPMGEWGGGGEWGSETAPHAALVR